MQNEDKALGKPNRESRVGHFRRPIATAFGVTSESRAATVSAMFKANLAESVGYWFQLILSMVIATLGLVLSSSGVVIAAMLIAPLMGPIVQIGMALAIGSPLMAIRSFTRAVLSIGLVVSSAAVITVLLPFQEVTPEIAARTSPTVLDLIIAGCCALAGVFATVRPGSETTGTAAGTAIGIALVPPLCVIGFGLGSNQTQIASGASLLFTANLCAILLFAVLMFIALGFDEVDVEELEAPSMNGLKGHSLTVALAQRLEGVIGSRYSTVLRVLMPIALMLGVYVPLSQALGEVTWQVRVRSAIQKLLQDSPVTRDAVRSVVTVEHNTVAVRLVVVAEGTEAARLEENLKTQIAAAAGVIPTIDLVTVPDLAALKAAASAWDRASAPDVPRPPDLGHLRRKLTATLGDHWPADAAGALLSWSIEFTAEGIPGIQVVHLGVPLGPAGEALLSQTLSSDMGSKVRVVDRALTPNEWALIPGEEGRWLVELARAVDTVQQYKNLTLYIQQPVKDIVRPGTLPISAPTLLESQRIPQERICMGAGERWTLRLSTEPCPRALPLDAPPEAPSTDGGVVPSPSDSSGAVPARGIEPVRTGRSRSDSATGAKQ